MVRDIVHDVIFLGKRSETATAQDTSIADDLMDTLKANSERCVGMAANMIGFSKRIIAFQDGSNYSEMFNPIILKASDPFETSEGCLSLTGSREVTRYHSIKVQWQTRTMKPRIKTFTGWTAQIIQHEIDHCNGIII